MRLSRPKSAMNQGSPAAGSVPGANGGRNRSAARSMMLRLYVCSSGFHVDISLGAASVQLCSFSDDSGWPGKLIVPLVPRVGALIAGGFVLAFSGAFGSSGVSNAST